MVPANNHAGILIYTFPIKTRNRRGIKSTARGIHSYHNQHPSPGSVSGIILPLLKQKTLMSTGLLAFIVLAGLILLYVLIQQNRKTRDKGQEKLINRNVPPYGPDNTPAGGGHDE